MKRKKTIIILAALLVVIAAVIVIEILVTHHVDQVNTVDEIVFTVDEDAATAIEWTTEGVTLKFAKTDGTWNDAEDAAFPVDQDAISELIGHFAEVHASFIISDVQDYSQYGLTDPDGSITFTTADGDSSIKFGTFSTMDSKRYIETDDGRVFLIDDDLLEYLSSERDDYLKKESVPVYDTVTNIDETGDNSLTVVYDAETQHSWIADAHYYQMDGETYLPLKDDNVTELIATFNALDLTDYVTYSASDEDETAYGLETPSYAFTVTGTLDDESSSVTFYVGKVVTPAESSDEEDTVTGYLQFEDSTVIWKLDDTVYEALSNASYDSLRDSTVLPVDWDTVTGFSFTLDGETYTAEKGVDKDEDGNTETIYTINGEKISESTAFSAAKALVIDKFSDDGPGEIQEVSFTLNLDNTEMSAVTVDLYQVDGSKCYAVVNGENYGYLTRSQMASLKEALTCIVLDLE